MMEGTGGLAGGALERIRRPPPGDAGRGRGDRCSRESVEVEGFEAADVSYPGLWRRSPQIGESVGFPVTMAAGIEAARRGRAWEEHQQRIYRRRRMLALVVGFVLLVVLVKGCSAVVGGGADEAASEAAVPQLPRGGREILPRNRIVAYYGAPQDPELGVLGIGSP